MSANKINQLQKQINILQEENKRLKRENNHLTSLLSVNSFNQPTKKPAIPVKNMTSKKKAILHKRVAIFRDLFRGREDVYPVRWESNNGKSGYSPACANEWVRPICQKPVIKCSVCAH